MTFGVAIRVSGGVVGLADTRVVRGEQHSTKAKISSVHHGNGEAVIMTSGLRSVRDKTMLLLDEELERTDTPCHRIHELATRYGNVLRRVHDEDAAALASAGLSFNVHTIIAGRLGGDDRPELIYVYPEGNWILATTDAPFFTIGRTTYSKPLLDRLVRHDLSMPTALGAAFLAFDATRTSVVDVDFPVDVFSHTSSRTTQRRYHAADLEATSRFWHDRLATCLRELPDAWTADLLRTT